MRSEHVLTPKRPAPRRSSSRRKPDRPRRKPAWSDCTIYGPCEEWCALFASWVWKHAGVPLPGSTAVYGYSGSLYTWAKEHGGRILPATATPAPGDAVFYGSGPTNSAHVGIVQRVYPDGQITTIEGNYAGHVTLVGPFLPSSPVGETARSTATPSHPNSLRSVTPSRLPSRGGCSSKPSGRAAQPVEHEQGAADERASISALCRARATPGGCSRACAGRARPGRGVVSVQRRHDSTVLAHRCREHYQALAWIDTGTAVPGVAEFVVEYADWLGKPLRVLDAGTPTARW